MKVLLRLSEVRLPRLNEDIVWHATIAAIVIAAAVWLVSWATPLPSVIH